MFRVILRTAVAAAALTSASISAKAVEVYMFKGAGDLSFINEKMHFSLGLNQMADILNKEGIHSEVRRFEAVEDALATIRARKPKTIAFIGHSMGALASIEMAKTLRNEGVRIVYMGLIDIPGPVGMAQDNVDWVENYYSDNPFFGKMLNTARHRKAKDIHVPGYMHNRMDDAPEVQNGMLSAIRQIHASEQQLNTPQDQQKLYVGALQTGPATTASVASSYVSPAPQTLQSQVQKLNGNQLNYPSQSVASQSEVVTPYSLPSVDVGAPKSQIVQSQDPLIYRQAGQETPANSNVDPVSTSSVQQPGLIDRSRTLFNRASNAVRRWNGDRNQRAHSFARRTER